MMEIFLAHSRHRRLSTHKELVLFRYYNMLMKKQPALFYLYIYRKQFFCFQLPSHLKIQSDNGSDSILSGTRPMLLPNFQGRQQACCNRHNQIYGHEANFRRSSKAGIN